MVSVNSNKAALVALQNLNRSTASLTMTQNRVSTGLEVNGARDNAAIWAIAQAQRSDNSSLDAVKDSLNRATSLVDVTLAAGESISDILTQMRQKAVGAADPSATAASRQAYQDEFNVLRASVQQFATSATFDDVNILNGVLTADLEFLADADASANTIKLTPQNMTTGVAPGLDLDALDLTTPGTPASAGPPPVAAVPSGAFEAITAIEAAQTRVTASLSVVGAQAKQIEAHLIFVGKLQDSLEVGVGNLVDADLARESARLQALQVQQQLGAQALSIANQSPQIVLSLFRG